MTTWALVAVNARAKCKTRLARVLDPATRLVLVRAMLAHVLEVVESSPAIDRVAVVSPERDEVRRDLLVIQDGGDGINAEFRRALAHAHGSGADRALLLPADLPRLQVADVQAMLEASSLGVALAPDNAEVGTNAIALSLPGRLEPSFGSGSFKRHMAGATGLGATVIVRRAGLADLDTPSDFILLRDCDWAAVSGLQHLADRVTAPIPIR